MPYEIAMMMLAGRVYGSPAEACLLAGLHEETKGDPSLLWRPKFGPFGEEVQKAPREFVDRSALSGSQHEALVRVHAEVAPLLLRPSGGGGSARRARRPADASIAGSSETRVWQAASRFEARARARLIRFRPRNERAVLNSWPFCAVRDRREIAEASQGLGVALLLSKLPRALVLRRGGADGRPMAAEAALKTLYAVPSEIAGKAGDVVVCDRLSVTHGGAGGRSMPPQAEFATLFRSSAKLTAALEKRLASAGHHGALAARGSSNASLKEAP